MLCAKIEYRTVGGPLSVVNVFAQVEASQVHCLQSPAEWKKDEKKEMEGLGRVTDPDRSTTKRREDLHKAVGRPDD